MIQFAAALHGLFVEENLVEKIARRRGAHNGQGLVEYALIIAFIAVVVIVAMVFLQERISGMFNVAGEAVEGCPDGFHPVNTGETVYEIMCEPN